MRLVLFVFVCGGWLLSLVGCRAPGLRSDQAAVIPKPAPTETRASAVPAQRTLPSEPETGQEIVAVGHDEQISEEEGTPKSDVDAPLTTGDSLSVSQLVAEVQAVHPSVEAMYAAWQAASQRYPQVTALDDPMFGVMFAPASIGSRTVEDAYALEASQKIPWRGKRALRGAAANWEAYGAAQDVETTRRKLAEVVELAFWDYSLARGQLELNRRNAAILESFRKNAVNRYETGLVTQQDVLQADVELANLEQRRIELVRMDRVAAGRINILLRRPPAAPLPPPQMAVGDTALSPDLDLLLAVAGEQRTDVSSAAARVQTEQAKLALTYKQYYPDAEFFGRYDTFWQPRSTQSDLRGQLGVRVNVPLYHQRLNAAVCEAMQQVAKAHAEHEQLMLDVQAEVQEAYEQLRESQQTVVLYAEKLIPASEQNVAAARSSYDTSKINFLDLAIAQRQLIEARDRQLQAQVELHRRRATLRRAVGGALPENSSADVPSEL